ncbi:MAG: type II toxin-antitoxin system RelE/ParE family toxin [Chloroflexota bacterium]
MAGRYRIDFAPAARRQLAKLTPDVQRRIALAVDRLEVDPRPAGVIRLTDGARVPMWRIRIGDYRVIYEIHDDRLLVLVIRIGDRANVYRLR